MKLVTLSFYLASSGTIASREKERRVSWKSPVSEGGSGRSMRLSITGPALRAMVSSQTRSAPSHFVLFALFALFALLSSSPRVTLPNLPNVGAPERYSLFLLFLVPSFLVFLPSCSYQPPSFSPSLVWVATPFDAASLHWCQHLHSSGPFESSPRRGLGKERGQREGGGNVRGRRRGISRE